MKQVYQNPKFTTQEPDQKAQMMKHSV